MPYAPEGATGIRMNEWTSRFRRPWLHHYNNIRRGVRAMKLLMILESSRVSIVHEKQKRVPQTAAQILRQGHASRDYCIQILRQGHASRDYCIQILRQGHASRDYCIRTLHCVHHKQMLLRCTCTSGCCWTGIYVYVYLEIYGLAQVFWLGC
jgi:hypothetical protein